MFKNTTSRNLNQRLIKADSASQWQTPSKKVTFLSTPVTVWAFISEVWRGSYNNNMVMWCSENQRHHTTSVPSMSNSWPWLPSRVRDRKGAKSTKISLSRGATFSKALSSFVVMLSREHIKTQVTKYNRKDFWTREKWKKGNGLFHQCMRRAAWSSQLTQCTQLTAVSV